MFSTSPGPRLLTVEELLALGGMKFVAGANVTLVDTASKIATLSPEKIAALSGSGDRCHRCDRQRAVDLHLERIDRRGWGCHLHCHLSESTTGPVSVTYGTTEGTASAADFTAASGTLHFEAGQTSKTITVQTTHDSDVELDETFNVVLSDPTGATLAGATGVGTITNDDVPPPPPVVP